MYALKAPAYPAYLVSGLHHDYALSRYARRRSPWPGRLRNAGLVVGAAVALSLGLATAAQGQAPAAYETYTVQPGDTLWSIAADRYPGRDVRAEVYRIQTENHLRDGRITAGETLTVPTR